MRQEYFSVDEFAKMMKVSDVTIRRAIKRGRINAFRVGAGKRSPFRISTAEVDRIQLMSHEEMKESFEV